MDYNGDSNNTIMTWDFPPFSWFSCVLGSIRLSPKYTGWWFGTFFIFPYIWNNNPSLLIFFRGVETTNQYIYMSPLGSICANSVTSLWRAKLFAVRPQGPFTQRWGSCGLLQLFVGLNHVFLSASDPSDPSDHSRWCPRSITFSWWT